MTVTEVVARTAAATDSGPRNCNEDRVVTWTSSTGDAALAAVADGMGGQAGGAVASQLAADGLLHGLSSADSTALDMAWLTSVVNQVNDQIRLRAATPGLGGMGTTLTAILVTRSEILVANIGDSRCYCVGPSGIERLTEDHSVTADAIRRGLLTPEKAVNHPYAHALTRALGTDATAELDITTHPLPESGAVYVACSDGVWNVLSDQDLNALVRHGDTLQASAGSIVSAAVAAGSNDNATVALLEIGELPRSNPPVRANDLAFQPTIRLHRPAIRPRWLRRVLLLLCILLVAGGALWAGLTRSGQPKPRVRGRPLASAAIPAASPAAPSHYVVITLDGMDSARASTDSRVLGWVRGGSPLGVEVPAGQTVRLRRFPSGVRDSFVVGAGPDSIRLPGLTRSRP